MRNLKNVLKKHTLKIIVGIAAILLILLKVFYTEIYNWLTNTHFIDFMKARNIRNNNPLNLRISGAKWHGKITPSQDKEFEQFKSMLYGARAGLKNLQTHYKRGNNTIRKLVSIWAPSNENDTEAYVNAVSKRVGIRPDSVIGSEHITTLIPIAHAMSIHEGGGGIDKKIFSEAWQMIK